MTLYMGYEATTGATVNVQLSQNSGLRLIPCRVQGTQHSTDTQTHMNNMITCKLIQREPWSDREKERERAQWLLCIQNDLHGVAAAAYYYTEMNEVRMNDEKKSDK